MRFDSSDFILQFLKLTAFPTQFFLDGGIGFKITNLSEVGDTDSGSELDVARVLLLFTDGVEQRGLSCTVVADNSNAVSVVDLEVDVAKNVNGTERTVDVLDVDEFASHGGPRFGAAVSC